MYKAKFLDRLYIFFFYNFGGFFCSFFVFLFFLNNKTLSIIMALQPLNTAMPQRQRFMQLQGGMTPEAQTETPTLLNTHQPDSWSTSLADLSCCFCHPVWYNLLSDFLWGTVRSCSYSPSRAQEHLGVTPTLPPPIPPAASKHHRFNQKQPLKENRDNPPENQGSRR